MTTHRVHLADAPTDVLVYLVGLPYDAYRDAPQIAEAVAPTDAVEDAVTVFTALRLLIDCGYVDRRRVRNRRTKFRATNAGRLAVAEALVASDSHASVSPEQTPSPADDSAHSGDHSTVGETP